MGITDALKDYVPEKSTVGEKPTLKGVYKVSLYDVAFMEDKGYGESIYAQFKVDDDGVIAGDKTYAKFPEFREYYQISAERVNNKSNGLKKLLDGLFSVGVDVDRSSDEALLANLQSLKGTTMYINAWKGKKQKKKEDGTWEVDPEGGSKQKFVFMTEKNALSKAKKSEVPF
jgi:flagellar hook protein FlgE